MTRPFSAVVLSLAAILSLAFTAAAPAAGKRPATTAKPTDADVTALLELMDETTSLDTFVTALATAVALDPDREGLIAAAIRKADRLGLLMGAAVDKESKECTKFWKALQVLVKRRQEVKAEADALKRARKEARAQARHKADAGAQVDAAKRP